MRSFYFWVNFVIGGVLYPYGIAFVWSFMLTSRWKKCSKFLAATAMVLAVLGPGVVRILDIGGPLFVLMEIVQLILFILYLGIFFCGSVVEEADDVCFLCGTGACSGDHCAAFLYKHGAGLQF